MNKDERPEALAQFAESARRGERAGVAGLTATKVTEPIPTDPKAKQDAATRVLAEGATGEDLTSGKAVNALPDRILESQEKFNETEEAGESNDDQGPEFDQAPGRMVSPRSSSEESLSDPTLEAIDALIMKGISREATTELLEEVGLPSPGERIEEWAERATGATPSNERRKQILAEHHEKGLPPSEPPAMKE